MFEYSQNLPVMKTKLLTLILLITATIGYSQSGSISNIQVMQRPDGSKLVDINYNLSGEAVSYNIALKVSFDDGVTYTDIPAENLQGDTGPISPGGIKHIIWYAGVDFPNIYNINTRLRIIAFVGVQGGTPCPDMPTVTDIDGNVYQTVLINDRCWMAENLMTTKYQNGDAIAYPGTGNEQWESNVSGAYAWYDNDIDWKDSYGALYNWYAVNNPAGLCPEGWHVPTHDEWQALVNYTESDDIFTGRALTNKNHL